MKKAFVLLTAVCLFISSFASADTFGTGANQFEIDFVDINGDSGDLGSWPAGVGYTFTGVNHGDYRMGKYEITNEQWNKFQIAYGTVTGSPSSAYGENAYWTGTNVPTNKVSWYEAAQFVNWLNVSTGHQAAYKFTGTQGTSDYTFVVWDPADIGYYAGNPYRNSNAYYFLPNEDEWVKAAYWNGTNLQMYATPDDTVPVEDVEATYGYEDGAQPWSVGSGSEELNGTFDMMGNMWEWLESPFGQYMPDTLRSIRGTSYVTDYENELRSTFRSHGEPNYEYHVLGFRVASVSEPANVKPVADAGINQTGYAWYDGLAEIYLDGTGSYDPDGDDLEYFWFADSNEITTGPEPNILLPVGEHTIELIVNDGVEDSEPNSCVITVLPAIETQISARPGVISMQRMPIDMFVKMQLPSEVEPFDLTVPMTLEPWGIEPYDQYIVIHGKNNLVYAYFTLDSTLEFPADSMTVTAVGQLLSGQYIYGIDTIKIHKQVIK